MTKETDVQQKQPNTTFDPVAPHRDLYGTPELSKFGQELWDQYIAYHYQNRAALHVLDRNRRQSPYAIFITLEQVQVAANLLRIAKERATQSNYSVELPAKKNILTEHQSWYP